MLSNCSGVFFMLEKFEKIREFSPEFLPVQIQPRAFSPASTLFTIPKRIPLHT